MKIKKLIANSGNYGSKRKTSTIKYIVIHYTGNNTDKAVNNANYFKNNTVKASAHYFVDSTSIYQSVQDDYVAWAVGGVKFTDCASTGGGTMYKVVTNANSVSLELCSENGEFKEETIQNAVYLVKELREKYNIPITNIVRHFDVTGKHCPAYWCCSQKNDYKWNEFVVRCMKESDIPNVINSNSKVYIINWMKYYLNNFDVGMEKLVLNGSYNIKTVKYVVKVWEKLNWKQSSGKGIGKATIAKLKEFM